MLVLCLLWLLPLTLGVTSPEPCDKNGECPKNYYCCGLLIGCWPKGHCCPPSPGEGPSCPEKKTVGETCYERFEDGVDTSQYGCTANCTYKKVGDYGEDERFCFHQPGRLPVTYDCMPPGEPIVRIRKNLTLLSPLEIKELKSALREAKFSCTYKNPWKIPNGHDFNSSYNAAVAFHGYPGLCGGSECCIHGYSTFLPWHRLFMVQIEDALRQNRKYRHITLPYWDWTQDFTHLPPLVTNDSKHNPFYHSQIPGKPNYTMRSSQVLINYTHFHCLENNSYCDWYNFTAYPDISKLGDMVLTALEEKHYESFEAQIEHPHNQVHNQLGFTPNTTECFQNDTDCYPYTMLNLYYAAYDPIFLVFHTMVDYQWAIFQALQKYRCIGKGKECPFTYENDCHPSFTRELAPFNTDKYNRNEATRKHPTGQHVVNYTQSLRYKYENLQLFGKNISELDKFLKERNHNDRLYAGFSLPNMRIKLIRFVLCYPITNCKYSSPDFSIVKIHGNQEAKTGVYQDKLLYIFDVTPHLSHFHLNASQDIGFKIISSSIPSNVTFTPVSIFRKANTSRDRITIHWRKDRPVHTYAPFFKTRPKEDTSIRFLVEDGSMSVVQYPDRESFQSCLNGKIVSQEIAIAENKTFFFQNPLRLECIEENKLQIKMSKPCDFPPLYKYANGSGIIGWQEDMTRYKDGICMEPGTHLSFEWREGNHNIARVADQDDFKNCTNFTKLQQTSECPAPNLHHQVRIMTYPPFHEEGFKLGEDYYIVCPCWGHCNRGMKLKISIKEKCHRNIF